MAIYPPQLCRSYYIRKAIQHSNGIFFIFVLSNLKNKNKTKKSWTRPPALPISHILPPGPVTLRPCNLNAKITVFSLAYQRYFYKFVNVVYTMRGGVAKIKLSTCKTRYKFKSEIVERFGARFICTHANRVLLRPPTPSPSPRRLN